MAGDPVDLVVGWTATDVNGHMRSPAYLEAANDRRMQAFHDAGWPLARFRTERIGPVLLREEITFRRELSMNAHATVDLALAGLSTNGSRWRLRCTVRHTCGEIAASVTGSGGWVQLDERRLVSPPRDLLMAMRTLPPTDDDEFG